MNEIKNHYMVEKTFSTASGQRCTFCGKTYPLFPPVTAGCPACATEEFIAPLELTYDYPAGTDWLPEHPLPGLTRYSGLLPPMIKNLSMGEGGTALIQYLSKAPEGGPDVFIKDESRNPTWKS